MKECCFMLCRYFLTLYIHWYFSFISNGSVLYTDNLLLYAVLILNYAAVLIIITDILFLNAVFLLSYLVRWNVLK